MSEQNSTEPNLDYQGGRPAVREAHDSVRREKPDPVAGGGNKVLISRVVVGGIILAAASGYFSAYSNSFDRSDEFSYQFSYPDYVAAPRPEIGGVVEEDKPWIETWMADGKKIYNNCIGCHQASGMGTPGLFPPLKSSDWVDGGTERLSMIVLSGVTGPIDVAGSTYNNPAMQPWKVLSDEKLAQVLTYVRRNFGVMPDGKSGVVTTEMMKIAREKHGARSTQWTVAELEAVPADADLPGAEVDLNTGKPAGEDSSGENEESADGEK